MNLRSLKRNRVYLDLLNMSKIDDGSTNIGKKMSVLSLSRVNMLNAGDFSWGWILKDFIQVQKEEGKLVVACPCPT